MKTRPLALSCIIVLFCTLLVRADSRVEESGRLDRLACGKGWVSLRSDIRVPMKGWGRSLTLSESRQVQRTVVDGKPVWKTTLSDGGNQVMRIEQAVRDESGKLVFDIKAESLSDAPIEGVMFMLTLPSDVYKAGQLRAADRTIAIPATLPAEIHFFNAPADRLTFVDPAGRTRVQVVTSKSVQTDVQDGRKWTNEFQAMTYIHRGNLPKGQTAQLEITLSAEGEVDQTAANVTIDASQSLYKLTGIGGNYCFNIESPVTKHTLANLNVAAARTEMSIRAWAPKKTVEDPNSTDYAPYAVADQPGSRLRGELELMRLFTQKRIPFTTSIWRMPSWLVEPVSPEGGRQRVRISEQNWPDVLQTIGAYLKYAKEKYQAEPDYFSFNEPDIGVDVLQTPEEHREAIKRFGAHFARLGLKTKLLLGDVCNPRGTHKFCLPAAADPEAMKYVGAISFHSWGGATAEQYQAWAELSQRLQRPLICGEAGVDAQAWRNRSYRSFPYFVREMVHYQQLLTHARPQSILYWEFTGDYSLMATDQPSTNPLADTERFCLQKHWCELTPAGSDALQVRSDKIAISATAFRAGGSYSVHLANPLWDRYVTVSGVPNEVRSMQVIRTTKGKFFERLESVPVRDGKVNLLLPAESMTTLTTLPVR